MKLRFPKPLGLGGSPAGLGGQLSEKSAQAMEGLVQAPREPHKGRGHRAQR